MRFTPHTLIAHAAAFLSLFALGRPASAQVVINPMTPVPMDIVIDPERELMITDLGVVEDPVRTGPGGVWTSRHLIETMAGPHDPPISS